MKNVLKGIAFVSVYIISALVLYFCRTIPVAKIWDNYNVAYIENSLPEEIALQYFYSAGCKDVIAMGLQKVPEVPTDIPVMKNHSNPFNGYIQSRLAYFTDKEHTFQLFYIPTSYEERTAEAVANIEKFENVKAGMDDKQAYPWLLTVVSLLYFIALTFLSENKKVFIFPGILFSMMGFFVAEHSVQAAAIVSQLTVFMIQRVWHRKYALKQLLTNPYFDILLVSSVTMLILSSIKTFFFALMISAFSVVILMLLREYEKYKDQNYTFKFDMLFTAQHFTIMTKRNALILTSSFAPLALILIIFLMQAKFSPMTTGTGLLIPAPKIQQKGEVVEEVLSNEDALPVIDDFYEWCYLNLAYPYRNLNDKSAEEKYVSAKPGDKVTERHFTLGEEGIVEQEVTVLEYNADFEKKAAGIVKSLDYPAIEKFLSAQERGIEITYSATANTKVQNDKLSLVIIIVAMCIPLLLAAAYFTIDKGHKEK